MPEHITLLPFTEADITDRYIGWLNDPEVNRYSRRRDLPPSDAAAALKYLRASGDTAPIWKIGVAGDHVGNIQASLDEHNRRADISIVIGERSVWGKGVGAAAVYTLSRHLFSRGLHRVDAGTCNPAFVRLVEKLGWVLEGRQRQRVMLGGVLHDYWLLAQLASEFGNSLVRVRLPRLPL